MPKLKLVAGVVLASLAYGPHSSFAGAQSLTESQRAAVWLSGVRVNANVTYSTQSNVDLKLDVYRPRLAPGQAGPGGPYPVVVEIHGGGWIAGTKEGSIMTLMPWLERGWAAVNVEYRLGRVAPAPAAVEDSRCALRWVARDAKNYGFDPSRIVVAGGSAGGHLALTTGMLRAADGLDYECAGNKFDTWAGPQPEPEPKVAAIVNWFGIADVPAMLAGDETRGYAVEWLGSAGGDPVARAITAKRVSPMSYVRAGTAPIITIHGDNDTLVPYAQSVRLHQALTKAGVPNKLVTIPGGGHGGFTVDQDITAYTAIFDFLAAQK